MQSDQPLRLPTSVRSQALVLFHAFLRAKTLERATVPHQPELGVAVCAVVLHTFCSMSQNVLVDAPTLAQSTIAQMAVQKMHVIVQKKQVAFVDNGPQHQTGRGADAGAAQTHKATRAAAINDHRWRILRQSTQARQRDRCCARQTRPSQGSPPDHVDQIL